MNSNTDQSPTSEDRWDRIMCRKLDGVSDPEEMLELDRELIRQPDLRRRWEEFERIDRLAAASLREAMSGGALHLAAAKTDEEIARRAMDPGCVGRRSRTLKVSRSRQYRSWFFIPGAIAAALAAMVIPRPDDRKQEPFYRESVIADRFAVTKSPSESASDNVPGDSDWMRTVGTTRRSTGREVIGIIGDDGNLYFIEVDRTRTVRIPAFVTGGHEKNRL